MSHLDAFDGETLDLQIPTSLDGVRIDRALSILTGLSRAESVQLLASGAVSVDHKVITKASVPLVGDQHLRAVLPPPPDAAVRPDPTVEIDAVVIDEHFVIINKRAGVVTHPGAGQRDGTLVAGALARWPEMAELAEMGLCDPQRPGIVHRLDKGTSGLLVVARTATGFHSLSEQLAEREMERTYLGLVEGRLDEEHGVVDAPIGRSERTPTLMAVRRDGRSARTGYRVLARLQQPERTLLELKLETGRTHQIRVHMAAISHPIVNDQRYGQRREKKLNEERFFLHSMSLAFSHPVTSQRVSAEAVLPSDLSALVAGVWPQTDS